MKKLILIVLVVIGFTAVSFAQQSSATLTTTTSSVDIITPITLTMVDNMVFGAVASSTAGGQVQLNLDNSRTANGVSLGINTNVKAAQFKVDGEGSSTYIVTLPADDAVTLTSAAPGAVAMTLRNFTKSPGAGTLAGGTQNFKVGATLIVNAAQVSGSYTGQFSVTVAYN